MEGIAQITLASFKRLQDSGFRTVALEMGPWITSRSMLEGVDTALADYPHSVAFDSNGDLELMRFAAGAAQNPGEGLWGVDQSANAIHPFQRLEQLARSGAARRMARGAFLKAALQFGEYSKHDNATDVETLRQAFGKDAPAEATQIFDALRMSMRIFVAWRSANRGEIPFAETVTLRETYMKAQFDRFAEATKIEGKPAKVLFKMGGAHVMRGVGPNGVLTLGDHVEKSAQASGLSAFLIGIRGHNPESAFPPVEWYGDAPALVIDTQTLRNSDQFDRSDGSRVRALEGYDALIYIRDPANADKSEIRALQKQFKRSLLRRLAWLAAPLILVVVGAVSTLAVIVWRYARRSPPKASIAHEVVLMVASVVTLSIFVRQCLAIPVGGLSAGIAPTFFASLWLPLVCLMGLAVAVSLATLVLRHEFKGLRRIYLVVSHLAMISLVIGMWYWNLGGMLAG